MFIFINVVMYTRWSHICWLKYILCKTHTKINQLISTKLVLYCLPVEADNIYLNFDKFLAHSFHINICTNASQSNERSFAHSLSRSSNGVCNL